MLNKKFVSKLLYLFLVVLTIALIFKLSHLKSEIENRRDEKAAAAFEKNEDCGGIYGCIDDYLDFEGFDNVNGSSKFIVPDIVHLLYLQQTELKFFQVINIFSIYYNHKPGLIYIHCDNCSFHGKYWEWIKEELGLFKLIKIHQIPYHDTIFGIKYGWINHHRSDIWRLQVLMNYGGIYLDNDMYVVNSLHKYRKYELTTSSQGRNRGLGVQVYIAHKNARFLKTHFDSYRFNYTRNAWYWNAGYSPFEMLKNYKYLANVVEGLFGTEIKIHLLYQTYSTEWKAYDTIHLLINHRSYMDRYSPIKEFDEFNILNYTFTYGYMVRDIMKKMGKIQSGFVTI